MVNKNNVFICILCGRINKDVFVDKTVTLCTPWRTRTALHSWTKDHEQDHVSGLHSSSSSSSSSSWVFHSVLFLSSPVDLSQAGVQQQVYRSAGHEKTCSLRSAVWSETMIQPTANATHTRMNVSKHSFQPHCSTTPLLLLLLLNTMGLFLKPCRLFRLHFFYDDDTNGGQGWTPSSVYGRDGGQGLLQVPASLNPLTCLWAWWWRGWWTGRWPWWSTCGRAGAIWWCGPAGRASRHTRGLWWSRGWPQTPGLATQRCRPQQQPPLLSSQGRLHGPMGKNNHTSTRGRWYSDWLANDPTASMQRQNIDADRCIIRFYFDNLLAWMFVTLFRPSTPSHSRTRSPVKRGKQRKRAHVWAQNWNEDV